MTKSIVRKLLLVDTTLRHFPILSCSSTKGHHTNFKTSFFQPSAAKSEYTCQRVIREICFAEQTNHISTAENFPRESSFSFVAFHMSCIARTTKNGCCIIRKINYSPLLEEALSFFKFGRIQPCKSCSRRVCNRFQLSERHKKAKLRKNCNKAPLFPTLHMQKKNNIYGFFL